MKQRYEENPYFTNLSIDCITMNYPQTFHAQDGTTITISRAKKVLRSSFSSVHFSREIFQKLMRLKPRGLKVFLYIQYKLGKNSDRIMLPIKKVSEYTEQSQTTCIQGINDLVEIGLIAKKNRSTYWVNIAHLFKGDLMRFLNNNGLEDKLKSL